jgi:hypothetical protein
MPSEIYIKQNSTTWKKALSIKIKNSGVWTNVKNVWLNFSGLSWTRVWPLSGVFSTSDPYITTTSSGSTPIYFDGNPIRIGTTYYGRNGGWDPNGFTISSYTYTWPYYSSSDSTILYDELGNIGTGVYSSPSQALTISSSSTASAVDGKWISFRITANASNSAYSGTADSINTYGKIKVIRRTPQNISYNLTGEASVGSVLSFSSAWNITEAYKPDATRSTIKWYRVGSLSNIYDGGGRTEITSASGSYSYTIASGDTGYYIIAEETTFNTGSDYDIGVDQFINGQNQVTAVIESQVGSALSITNGRVEDFNDKNGLDNRFDFPVGASQAIKATISGVDSATTYRIRYRIYNWQNGSYYNISTGATGTASAVWTTFTADSSGSGNISDVTISGTNAFLTDYIFIDETIFDGGTYSGGLYKWQIEIELSAIKTGGTRVYWVNPYQSYYLSRSINSTISVSPSTISPGSSTTISGSFFGYPAGNAYPRQYKINYGDGNDSGWLPVEEYSYGTVNPSYSISRTYSSGGTYFPSIETVPYYTTNSTTLTVASAVTQTFQPTVRATNTSSTSLVKYLDSITWSSGAYSNAASISSVLLYSTNSANLVAGPTANTSTSFRTANPYSISTVDATSPPYIFAVRDVVVGTNGTTYYFYSNQITAALADAISFSYGGATSNSGGWTASVNAGTQSGATYSFISANTGAGSVNSSTGAITASGLTAGQSSTITVQKSVSGYNSTTASASGSALALTKLSTPTGVNATDTRTDGVNVTWNAVSGAAYYGVWYGGTPGYDSLADFGGNRNTSLIVGTSYLDTSIGSGASRDYYVQAYRTGDPSNTKSDWGGPDNGTRASAVATPAITSGPFISWGSGNNFTLSATASNATNIEFQVQFANTSGGTVQNTATYFVGASVGTTTTGAQQYSWARTRARANNTTTGLSSAFTAYSNWA